jgi:hypothetical protein
MPLQRNISPFRSVPRLKEFDRDEFLRNLKQATPELAPALKVCSVYIRAQTKMKIFFKPISKIQKGNWFGLYRFVKNIFLWFNFNAILGPYDLSIAKTLL